MCASNQSPNHWLHLYGNKEYYKWQDASTPSGTRVFHRPLGLVEFAFDADGRYHEGRADMNSETDFEVRSDLSPTELRRKMLLAWTCLRTEHSLLAAQSINWTTNEAASNPQSDLHFVVQIPEKVDDAVRGAEETIVFLEDHYSSVDSPNFTFHAQNMTRVADPAKSLAKMFIHPVIPTENGNSILRVLIIGAHMIWDGLVNPLWLRNFNQLLNLSDDDINQRLKLSVKPEAIRKRLPPPQEALYPRINGSPARVRWFWLLTRILRHVRKPLEASFPNPIKRAEFKKPVALAPKYASVLDYSRLPPLSSYPCPMRAPLEHTYRLHQLCREAKASVGAGCFALAAIIMMELYERQEPNVPIAQRRPFIAGFPINPRPFFNHHSEPDSLMLSFCDGIVLPFLSSSLDLEGRIRLLARQAHRQLATYQKRARPAGEEASIQYMSSRGAGRVLANQYISSMERCNNILPPHLRKDVNPQGAYPARPNRTPQTCGVSSVGRRQAVISQKTYDLNDGGKEFMASFRDMRGNVRPRDGEFLVGIGGDEEGLFVNVSVDGSTLDPDLVELFKHRIETMLGVTEAEKARL